MSRVGDPRHGAVCTKKESKLRPFTNSTFTNSTVYHVVFLGRSVNGIEIMVIDYCELICCLHARMSLKRAQLHACNPT